MPNPLFLTVMGVSLATYNAYSPAKKARFQIAAQKKLAEVHETDMDAYTELTEETVRAQNDNAIQAAESDAADEEFK